MVKGIRKLAPGTMLVRRGRAAAASSDGIATDRCRSRPAKSDAEAREELTDIYKRALKRHLISDVPVGLLLSGGLDSGLLLSLMNLSGVSWPTYTVGYGSSFA